MSSCRRPAADIMLFDDDNTKVTIKCFIITKPKVTCSSHHHNHYVSILNT